MNDVNDQFSLETLCSLTSISQRTIRFYIQKGLVPRPEGAKKGSYYTQRHLEALLTIKRWQEAGLSLAKIEELLTEQSSPVKPQFPVAPKKQTGSIEVWSHIHISDGIELHIEPQQAGLSPEQTRVLAQMISDAYNTLASEQ